MLADVWFAVKTWEKIWHFSESNKLLFGRCSIISDVSVIPDCYCAFSGKNTHMHSHTHTHMQTYTLEKTQCQRLFTSTTHSCVQLYCNTIYKYDFFIYIFLIPLQLGGLRESGTQTETALLMMTYSSECVMSSSSKFYHSDTLKFKNKYFHVLVSSLSS